MKKRLLLISLLFAGTAANAQFTQANEVAIGTYPMYVVDTTGINFTNNLGATGQSATFDYSDVTMSTTNTSNIVVIDAEGSANESSFPDSDRAITIGPIQQYYNSTAASRISQGFVFNEASLGNVVATFDSDGATQMTYPFNYGSISTDDYTGSANIPNMGTATANGDVYASVSAEGTLKIPGMDITGVTLLKTIDTTGVSAMGGLINGQLIREQLEYYKFSEGNAPIFVDVRIKMAIPGTNLIQRLILSKEFGTLGLTTNEIENLVIFPNPSNGTFAVNGNFTKATVEVTDLTGKKVMNQEVVNGQTIAIAEAKAGIYIVKVMTEGKTSIQKITVK